VGKIAQSSQPPETNWDQEAEPLELGKFFQKIRNFKDILIHIFA